jgi:type I restriction enzyme R subunit
MSSYFELKNHEHKNIALEALKKLLNEEIKVRQKTNLVQSRSLMENAAKRHSKISKQKYSRAY